ncbi:MAG: glycosyltransferase family 39 protein [Caldimicrobium sp.]|nr:glycosyltransferase family 39 protein [Caldimicrobium sp.]MDW8181986.1 glycosyltransferase family 39 protein [Caldimicrobium sp.]
MPYLSGKEFQGEEGRRVLLALQMLESGEFFVPKLFEELYFNKPPLFNWALALLFKLTNDYSEFTARTLSVLAVIFTGLFLTYLWMNLIPTKSFLINLLPGLIFMTIPEVIDKALRAEIDAFYTMIITLGLFSWFYLSEIRQKKRLAFLVSGLFFGLGVLTKTFHALIFFYFAMVPYLLFQKRLGELRSFTHFLWFLGVFLSCLIWFLPVSLKIGLKPFISSWIAEYRSAARGDEMTLWQHLESYTIHAVVGFSPWIFTLFFLKSRAFISFLRENTSLRSLLVFSLALFLSSYVFHFLFPGARLRYTLPSISGLAFVSAIGFFYLFIQKSILRSSLVLQRIMPLTFIGLSFIFLLYLHKINYKPEIPFYFLYIFFILLNLYILLTKEFSFRRYFLYLVFLVFLLKHLYITFYYNFHQREMNYFRKASFEIASLIQPKRELYLCKVIPHHLLYYMKYRYKLIDNIHHLKTCESLPLDKNILFLRKDLPQELNYQYKTIPLKIRTKEYVIISTTKN